MLQFWKIITAILSILRFCKIAFVTWEHKWPRATSCWSYFEMVTIQLAVKLCWNIHRILQNKTRQSRLAQVWKSTREVNVLSTCFLRFVAHTFHPCVFLRVELLNVASTLARKLQLLSTWKAGEASLHVNPQAALGFVHLHVLTSGCLGVETKAQLSQGNSFWRMMASPCSFVMCSTRSGWDLMVKSHWEQRYRRFFRIQYRPSGPTLPSSTLNCAGRCSISKCSSIDLFTFDLWSQLESAQVYVARLSRIIIAVVTSEPDPLASVSSMSLQWTLVPCDEVTVLTLPPLWTAPLCLARLAELLAV